MEDSNSAGSASQIPYIGREVSFVRANPGSLIAYEEWRDDAACYSSPPEWFEISDDLMVRSGVAPDEQHDLIAKGLRVCNDCPVKRSCLTNSTKDDRKWTTRGGVPPEYLFDGPDRTVRKGKSRPTFKRGKECAKGHDVWTTRPDGRVFCYPCKQESDTKRERTRPTRDRNRHPKAV